MRLLFAGTPAAAVPSLRALLNAPQHEVVAVVSRPDAPAGRGRVMTSSPVSELARESGIELLQPARVTDPEFVARLTELDIDCAAVVAYGAILPPTVIGIPKHGWVNLHFSLLPAWRGAAPVQHAVLHADELTGASTFLIGPGLDDGPVYGVMTQGIGPRDTSGALLMKLAEAGAGLLLATMDGIADGSLQPQPQPVQGVSLAPKLTSADARVRFDRPGSAVDRQIRACTPAPGAWSMFRGQRLRLAPVRLAPEVDVLTPGELHVTADGVAVGTASMPVLLSDVQPAGKKMINALDWARGARIGAGDHFGD